jgi:hypothetical protein
MDLSLVTVEQFLEELEKRGIDYSVALSHNGCGEANLEQPEIELYSSFERPIYQSLHLLLGGVSILGGLLEEMEEAGDERIVEVRRWVDSGETLVSELIRAAQEWEGEQTD